MNFLSGGRVAAGLAAIAALLSLASPAYAAEPARPTVLKKYGKQAVAEAKHSSQVDFDLAIPSDASAPIFMGGGFQHQLGKNWDMRLDGVYGAKTTVTLMQFFIGGRYEFTKSKQYAVFGEGGIDYAMGSLRSQSASAVGLALGGGAEYSFTKEIYFTGDLRFHTVTLPVNYNGTKVTSTPPISIILGVGYRF